MYRTDSVRLRSDRTRESTLKRRNRQSRQIVQRDGRTHSYSADDRAAIAAGCIARTPFASDLTARANPRSNDEIVNLGRSFNAMAERIHTLLTTERQLLQDVSHELRSPPI